MARKYVRDNRGRFASGGSGATARGGRLKTASGNKRATQTMRAAGAGGVIKGRTARTVAGQKVMAKLAKRAEQAAGKVYRTRAQAAARQKERNRMTLDQVGRPSKTIKAVSNRQGNVLTGRTDRHVVGYKAGPTKGSYEPLSKSFRRARTRQTRTGERIMQLNSQRSNLIASTPSKRFSKRSNPEYRQLFKIQKSIQTQQRASDFYDANPRAARRRPGSRR